MATALASVASSLVLLRQVRIKTLSWARLALPRNGASCDSLGNQSDMSTVINGRPRLLYHLQNQTAAAASPDTHNATNLDTVDQRYTEIARRQQSQQQQQQDAAKTVRSTAPHPPPRSNNNNNHKDDSISFLSWPDRTNFQQLLVLCGPIFFVILAKVVCYSAMTLRATSFGILELASHNIMMRIFFFFATFGDSLSQAAQTYLPQVLVSTKETASSSSKRRGIRKLLDRLGLLSAGIGMFSLVCSKWIVDHCGRYFTTHPEILHLMTEHSTPMSLALLLHPFIMTFEGTMIATSDLRYMVATYVVTMGLLFGQLQGLTASFSGVWWALLVFQTLRLVQCSTRVWNRTLRRSARHKKPLATVTL